METNKHDFKKSKPPLCPPGYILRDAYKTKTGKVVPDRCIKSTSSSNEKIEEKMKKYEKKLERKLEEVNKKIMKEYCNDEGCPLDQQCPPGKILRNPYERKSYRKKDGTLVKGSLVLPSCITDRGMPGKGSKKIFIDPNDHLLSEHGYDNVKSLSKSKRQEILVKAIDSLKKKGKTEMVAFNEIIHRLIGRANLQKKTNPDVYKIFKEDQEFISKMYKDVKGNNNRNKKKISEHITDMKKKLKNLKNNEKLKPHVKEVEEKIVIFKENISNSNKEQIKKELSAIRNYINKLEKVQEGGDLKGILKKGVNTVKSVGKKSVEAVKSVGKKSIEAVKSVGKKSLGAVESVSKKSVGIVKSVGKKSLGTAESVGKKSVGIVKSVGKKSVGVVKSVGKKSVGVVKSVGKKTSNVAKSSYEKLKMKMPKEKKMVKKLNKDIKKVGKDSKKMALKPVSFSILKMKLKRLQKSKNIKIKKEARKLYNKLKLVDKSKMTKERLNKFMKKVVKLEKLDN